MALGLQDASGILLNEGEQSPEHAPVEEAVGENEVMAE